MSREEREIQRGTVASSSLLSGYSLLQVFVSLIILWILISLWSGTTDNVLYKTIGLDRNFWFHTLVIAVIASLFLLVFIYTRGPDVATRIEANV